MSRINLEDNLAKRLRAQAITFSTIEATLEGPYEISKPIESIAGPNQGQGGATFHFLNPGGDDRDVYLPVIHPGGGQFYIIANQGPTGVLRIRDNGGTLLKTIDPNANILCVSSKLVWHTLPLSPSGTTGIISTEGPTSSTQLAGFKDGTGLVIRAVTPGPGLDLSNGVDLKLDDDLVALAAVVGVDAFFYRKAGAPPTWEPVVIGTGLAFDPVTGILTSTPAPIADGSITDAKLANVPSPSFKARVTAGFGPPENITPTQATAQLDLFTSALKGLAPGSGGGTTNFLRADGSWAAPPGGGGGGASVSISDTPPGSPTAGDMWWESDTGTLWIYYNDGTSSQWVMAAGGSSSPAVGAPNCGRLIYQSTSNLQFLPYNGDAIKINGVVYQIPSGGIVGLGITGVFVNGTAGQNLAADTTYLVCAFNNSGTITADYRTTLTHAASTVAGNVGVEVPTGLDSRTVIGLARTVTGANFANDAARRHCISWFNRRDIAVIGASTANASTSSTTAIELNVNSRASFVTWGDEAIQVGMSGFARCNVAGAINVNIGLDGAASSIMNPALLVDAFHVDYWHQFGAGAAYSPAEGYHFLTPVGSVSVGTGLFSIANTAMIRG